MFDLVWPLVVHSTVTKMLVVCSTSVYLFVASSSFIKMFGRMFDLSFAVDGQSDVLVNVWSCVRSQFCCW